MRSDRRVAPANLRAGRCGVGPASYPPSPAGAVKPPARRLGRSRVDARWRVHRRRRLARPTVGYYGVLGPGALCGWCPFSHLWNGLFASLARMVVPSLLAASTARVVRRRTMTRKRVALRCVPLRCVALRCVALRCVALRCAVPSATPPRAARGRLHNLEGRAGMVAARSLAWVWIRCEGLRPL